MRRMIVVLVLAICMLLAPLTTASASVPANGREYPAASSYLAGARHCFSGVVGAKLYLPWNRPGRRFALVIGENWSLHVHTIYVTAGRYHSTPLGSSWRGCI